MHDLDSVERRILGCLLEKQRTTPDTYPLTLNALRLACNQSTNRDPVVDYDEQTIQETLQRMHRRELTRVASGHGSRASKYRHLVGETLGLGDAQQALLCVLLLRGAQTPGELKQRSERLHPFADLAAVDETLAELIERGLAERLPRRPGEKQVRYRELLGGEGNAGAAASVDGVDGDVDLDDRVVGSVDGAPGESSAGPIDDLRAEVLALRIEVARLAAEVERLRAPRAAVESQSDLEA